MQFCRPAGGGERGENEEEGMVLGFRVREMARDFLSDIDIAGNAKL